MYPIERLSHCEFVPIRHLRYHVRQWGTPSSGETPWVMVHGWMDVSASFQFVVDALHKLGKNPWIIAPDWRGFGLTETPHQDSFWFPDYLADLDFLLAHYCPGQSLNLIGHSMGGHVASLYAGARPERIARLVNLEGFGMPTTRPAQSPKRHAQWMDELHSLHQGALQLRAYPSLAGVAERLMKTNPRLDATKAQWLAQHWAREAEDGQWHILGHSGHKIVNPHLFHVDETLASYANISAPTLCVVAQDDSIAQWWKERYSLDEFMQRYQHVPNLQHARMQDCGHMLHHDQPHALAVLLRDFLGANAPERP